MRKPRHCLSTIFSFLVAFVIVKCNCSSNGAGLSVSPVNHLEASVAASSAHASVAAVHSLQDDQEYVVIVSFKPSLSFESASFMRQKQQSTVTKPTTRKFGLTFAAADRKDSSPSRWTQMGASTVCIMTGFAADIQHLTGVVLNKVERHQSLLSQAMTVDRIVSTLAAPVQRAARYQGSRPYGIQALMVGLDANGTFQLYTVDPSGGWQHYGGGATAIGRHARAVRAELHKSLNVVAASGDSDITNEALKIAIESLIGEQMDDDDNDYTDKLEAFLVWKSPSGSCCVSRIDDAEIDACLRLFKEKR